MGGIVAGVLLALLGIPVIIGVWCFFLVEFDDVFFDGRYMEKIRAWNRRKREGKDNA